MESYQNCWHCQTWKPHGLPRPDAGQILQWCVETLILREHRPLGAKSYSDAVHSGRAEKNNGRWSEAAGRLQKRMDGCLSSDGVFKKLLFI